MFLLIFQGIVLGVSVIIKNVLYLEQNEYFLYYYPSI